MASDIESFFYNWWLVHMRAAFTLWNPQSSMHVLYPIDWSPTNQDVPLIWIKPELESSAELGSLEFNVPGAVYNP